MASGNMRGNQAEEEREERTLEEEEEEERRRTAPRVEWSDAESHSSVEEEEEEAMEDDEDDEERDDGEEEEEEEDSQVTPRSHRESLTLEADELEDDPLETAVFQLAQDVVTTEWADEELTAKLNMIAEALEEAEAAFRKDRTPPYRREGHLIGALLQVLEQHDEFYPLLEAKLGELVDARVRAAACRVLLATVSVNSRFIVRLLYDEETLDRLCDYAADAAPPLRGYATGLLAVGLRDRSVADIVVNKEVAVKFLKRIRLYASKLERERQQATKYIQDRLFRATTTTTTSTTTTTTPTTTARRRAWSMSGPTTTTTVRTNAGAAAASATTTGTASGALGATPPTTNRAMAGLKRKFSETSMRSVAAEGSPGMSLVSASHEDTDDMVEDDNVSSQAALPTATLPGTATATTTGDNDALVEGAASDILGFQPDPERHEEDLMRLVMLELLYTLDCIGLMGEYMELFAPALKEDIIGTIITFLHSKNPTVLSHAMKLTSHFLAHKKFCFSLIDAGGVELIFATAKALQGSGQLGFLDRSLSMCLHGLASSNAVMEKVLLMEAEALLTVSFGLLSSANDRARQNAVVFFGLTLSFKVVLDYFEKENGLYHLLNIIRAGNNPKSAVQRQLSHDACLCLRQYLRVHMALVTHKLRRRLSQLSHPGNRSSTLGTPVLTAAPALSRLPVRVPKFQASKPVDIDDKTHEQNLVFYEKYQFSVSSGAGSAPWSAASGPGGAMWAPAGKLSHLRGPLVMLEVVAMMVSLIQNGDPEENSNTIRVWIVERAQFCLECLRVLTLVVPSLSTEVCSTEVVVDESGTQKRAGMTILLEIATSSNARDSALVRDALYVFCNCVSPPHAEDCWQHPHKDIRQYTLTARDMRKQQTHGNSNHDNALTAEEDSVVACCPRVKDDKPQRPVRKLARAKNAIKVCVQLLRYKRSVQNADAIRLLATRALLGLSRDRHIAQILEKMQLGQLLSDLIRQDPVLEENADLHVRFRESALDLISLVTHRAPNAVINEATDPTVRKIEKASIVAQTPITYDQSELLRLIHGHLLAKGLRETAAALVRESKLDEAMPSDVAMLKTPEKSRERSLKNTARPSQIDVSSSAKSDSFPDAPRPSKISKLVLNPSTWVDAAKSVEHQTLARSSSDPITATPSAVIRLPHGERRKRVRRAFMSPHRFGPSQHSRHQMSASVPSLSTSKHGAHRQSSSQGSTNAATDKAQPTSHKPESSRLDEIITHYLREQHRQCANPVTTVPPFKLLGANAFHRCPDPSTLVKTPVNICSRLADRTRSSFRFGPRAFASPYTDAGVTRYVFSRYRPNRIVGNHGATHWGPSVARFYGDDQRELLMGNHDGLVRRVQIDTDQIVEEWTCHASSSAVVDLETNEHTRMHHANRLLVTGSVALTSFGMSEVAVWDVNAMADARWRFAGALSPRFNHYGDRIVALDARSRDEDHDMESDRHVLGAVVVDLATGSVLSELKDSVQSNDYGRDTNCCFAPDDSTILTGGMLWDARIPTRALYKFDKLSNVGYGFFHPNGNEVIVNSAVWDLRTYQLLRMVPALDKCTVQFNATGAVMFAYSPHSVVDDMERRRSKAKTWFRVLDARDYKDISTVELQRPLYDLAVDRKSTLLSAVEGRYLDADTSIDDDPVCRLYEIGRKRPSEDDSDVEDGQEGDSEAMDDDEFDNESDEEEDDDEDDEEEEDDDDDDDDDEEVYESDDYDEEGDDDGIEYVGGSDEGEDDSDDGNSSGTPDAAHTPRRSRSGPSLSARDIQLLFELPQGDYYDIHDDFSGDEEEEDDEG